MSDADAAIEVGIWRGTKAPAGWRFDGKPTDDREIERLWKRPVRARGAIWRQSLGGYWSAYLEMWPAGVDPRDADPEEVWNSTGRDVMALVRAVEREAQKRGAE